MQKYKDKGNKDAPSIVVRTCYDGDQFGEMTFFTNKMHQSKTSYKEQMQLVIKNQTAMGNIFDAKQQLVPKDIRNLTKEE